MSGVKRGRDGRRMSPASLANLKRGSNPAPTAGSLDQPARQHGGYAVVARSRLDAKQREIFDVLGDDLPLRVRGDSVPLRLLAEVLVRLDDIAADIRDHGWKDRQTGEPRPVLAREASLRREALDLSRELGLTPRAQVALGLDIARGQRFDLARELAALDDEEPSGA